MDDIRFEWGAAKARENVRKHGVSFEEARTVFADDNAILLDDPDHSASEERFALAVQGTAEGIFDWNVPANEVYLAPRFKALLGYEEPFLYKLSGYVAEMMKEAYPDPKRAPGNKLVVVDLEAVSALARPVTLAEIKGMAVFAESPLVRQGRLSVVPLTAAQWKAIEGRSRE